MREHASSGQTICNELTPEERKQMEWREKNFSAIVSLTSVQIQIQFVTYQQSIRRYLLT
jgi:hypothetical protein